MSTTDPRCTCGHTALDHSNIRSIGCTTPGCDCNQARRAVQNNADLVATNRALDAVERGTEASWALAASESIHALAAAGVPFTPDDIWEHLAMRGIEAPREPRALGPILKGAARAGDIKLEGYATSRRRHGALIRSYVGNL